MTVTQPGSLPATTTHHENTVAIVGGTGALGLGLATRWAHSGVNVRIGSRRAEAAQGCADKLPGAVGGDNTTMIEGAAAVVVAVPFSAHVETMRSIAKAIQPGQLVIDTTAPLLPVGPRGLRPIVPWAGSAAEQAQALLPDGTSIVSALQTVSAATLQDIELRLDEDVLLCGDHTADKTLAADLINRIPGLRTVDCGLLDMSGVCERITALLIGINRRYKTHAGIRLTGLPEPLARPGFGRSA
ncbi:NADPH-dependent F420 reductase [Streptomyces sp. SID8361]|uniref:NADPH-dependent F420 reductase n=1 Tax=Streptomyces sp. MnatMP-M27 TaxID=1839768 RepID=UPI00081DBD55|nr:NADPH-dependent F420 reductase [Streptomyces sp. MnatMP-M27]MYU14299.1 NADPH-dependent F420 reductase [Streptomyces sp. SID8361]SCG05264.1 reduced coenzyme F420:NADP oxidoreductase [Streptomyces sp. MnatMP-M27]